MLTKESLQDKITRLLNELKLTSEDQLWFEGLLREIAPGHGMRAIVTKDFIDHVHVIKPDAVGEFEVFQQMLTKVSPFSFMPLAEFFLLVAKAAMLCHPELDLKGAVTRFCYEVTVRVQDNPMFRTMRRAAGENLGSYIELASAADTGNYGKIELIKLNRDHYEVITHPDMYPELMQLISVPYYESLLEIFGAKGKVTTMLDDISGLCIELDWR